MKPEEQLQAIETTKEAFRKLAEQHRAFIFKKAGHASPRMIAALLEAAGISSAFQPARIDRWLRTGHLPKLENLVLLPRHQDWFKNLLCGFFRKAHKRLNDYLVAVVNTDGQKSIPLEEGLSAVRDKFPEDPYLDLYLATCRWILPDTIAAEQKCLDAFNQAPHEAAPGTQPKTLPVPATNTPSDPVSTSIQPQPGDLVELDKALQEVSDAVSKLRDVQPADLSATTASLQRAQSLQSSLTDTVTCLATDLGEPNPQWSSREEFLAHQTRLSALAAGRTEMRQRAATLVNEVSQLLAGLNIRHRIPSRSIALTALARDAVTQIGENAADLRTLILGHSGSACDWLNWLWQQEGEEAENYQQKLRPISPALADLLAQAHWPDLEWPATLPTTDQTQAPAEPPPQSSPPAIQSPAPAPTPAPPVPVQAPRTVPPTAVPTAVETSPKPPAVPEPAKPLGVSVPSGSLEIIAQIPEPTAEAKPAPKATASTRTEHTKSRLPQPEPAPTPQPPAPKSPPVSVSPPQSPSLPVRPHLVAATWRLARAGRWGLASHLSSLTDSPAVAPSWVFQAAALAPRISYEVSPISDRLAEIFTCSADFRPDSLDPDACPPTRLLLAAIALRPALLAPKTNAASILKLSGIKELPRLHALDQFVERVAEFGLHRQVLCPEMLRSSHNRADWERQLARVRTEVREWLDQAPSRGFNYAIAARIWRGWTSPNGPLRRLLEETAAANTQNAAAVKSRWEHWDRHAPELVQSAIKEINHRKTMDGTARDILIARIREAVQLADRVLVLLSQALQPGINFNTEQAHQLLAALQQNLRPARQELGELLSHADDDAVIAAASFCDATLAQTEYLLQGHLPLPGGDDPNPQLLLDAELLRDPSLPLATNGAVLPPGKSELSCILALAETAPNWTDAWARQAEVENHTATAALLEFFRWQNPPSLDVATLAREREQQLEACRRGVEKESVETRHLLDEFASLGFCRENDYLNWSAEVRNVEQALSSATIFSQLHERLQKIRASVQEQRDSETAKIRKRLVSCKTIQPGNHARITALLDTGDIHTVTDYLERAIRGLPLPDATASTSIFQVFFADGGWLAKAEDGLRNATLTDCWQAARDEASWIGLDFQFLGPDQRTTAVAHIQLWQNLERKRRVAEADVMQLAISLGLQPTKVEPRPGLTGTHIVQAFIVQAQPVTERSAAVVPAFGSDANGRYTLHLVWGEPDAEELLSLCRRDTGDTTGHIVVAFRVLNRKERRELAEEARKPDRVFKAIVVDRALFTFACAQPSARLSTILRCALPFSCVEPYTVAAGEVPPEMFFGRGRELESLAEPRGSCFVYGGRQLGKTALLRALKTRFHNLPQGRAAIFIDLKRELFSRGRPIDDLWSVIVNHLKDEGVLSDIKVGASAGQEALFRHIKDWLGAHPDRRLLLLLDEADSFLEHDGKEIDHYEPFPRCQRLKGLMDDTGRRFKVIFAGLHNVQRTTHSSNHPLAHFGDAICIGPMLEEAESREARALVEHPLGAAGYTFASADVVSRVLALTNYYPSLIQLFCHHLLLDLRANHMARFPNARLTPPCIITSNHIQTIYGSGVRKRIHEKVRLTLDLDKRYEVIACLLALYSGVQSDQDGMDLREIRVETITSWPAGFAEMRTDDEFRGLLEEMVGLGILRQVPGTNRFALRNENVTTLLGTLEEIDRHLESAKTWEPILKYEANKFRRLLTDKPKLLFSPLTAQQESELKGAENRVAILCGIPAAGLLEVAAAMESESLFGKSRTITLRDCSDASRLSECIADRDRPPRSHTVIIVPTEIAWDETWITAASQRVAQFTSKDAFVTVLFIAGPLRTAATLRGTDRAAEAGIRQITLRPWHDTAVCQWLEDLALQGDREIRDQILNATGNWPALLMRLNTASNESLRRSCDQLATFIKDPQHLPELRAAFGLADFVGSEPLRIAAELKRFTLAEVSEYMGAADNTARQHVADCLNLAERLGLVSNMPGGLVFDPIAATILQQTAKSA